MGRIVVTEFISVDGVVEAPSGTESPAARRTSSRAARRVTSSRRPARTAAGVLDELQVVPVLFGQGRRLFEGLAPEQIELERTRVLEGEGGVTHIHNRVLR